VKSKDYETPEEVEYMI
jgi:hypothetical protein